MQPSLSLYVEHIAKPRKCFVGQWNIILPQWEQIEMHINIFNTIRLLSVLVEAPHYLYKTRIDLFVLNYCFEASHLGFMRKVSSWCFEKSEDYVNALTLALFSFHFLREVTKYFWFEYYIFASENMTIYEKKNM